MLGYTKLETPVPLRSQTQSMYFCRLLENLPYDAIAYVVALHISLHLTKLYIK